MPPREIVITGVGVVSPLGIGRQAFWSALMAGTSGVGELTSFDGSALPVRLAAEVRDFNPQAFVKPRKSLKVMARDTQLGMTAAGLAREDAGLTVPSVDPDRFGVVFAADTINPTLGESADPYRPCIQEGQFHMDRWGTRGFDASFPLGMLKLLPNIIACHVSIGHDARNHNNTLYMNEVSGIQAIGEAASVIQRGAAEVMLAGGSSSRMQPLDWARACLLLELSHRHDAPGAASRPFDAHRDGQVRGEGAATLVLEERKHAVRRGATVLASVLGWGSSSEPRGAAAANVGSGLQRAIAMALRSAGIDPSEVGHVNAHGLSTIDSDRIEAQVLGGLLPATPVTAPKSYFGNLYAASGVIETAVSVLAIASGQVPATLNYEFPDPQCPLNVIRGEPLSGTSPVALVINRNITGQAAALVLGPP
jgi:3-oxoacyl-[acyl-carrier-protein] synthase II